MLHNKIIKNCKIKIKIVTGFTGVLDISGNAKVNSDFSKFTFIKIIKPRLQKIATLNAI